MPMEDSQATPPSQPAALMRAAQAIVDRRRQMAAAAVPLTAPGGDPPPPGTPTDPTARAPDPGASSLQGVDAKPGQLLGSIGTLTAPGADGSNYEVRHSDSGRLIAQGDSAQQAEWRAQGLAREWGRRRMMAWLQGGARTSQAALGDPQAGNTSEAKPSSTTPSSAHAASYTEGASDQSAQPKVFSSADWAAERVADPSLPNMVPRAQWAHYEPNLDANHDGLKPDPTKGQFKLITLHHTGSESTPEEVEALHRGHESTFHHLERAIAAGGEPERYGFADVGYNFLVAPEGTIYEGRSLKYQGAHVSGKNSGNIGIAFLGDYSSNPLSSAQIKSADALITRLNNFYDIPSRNPAGGYIHTHAEFDNTRRSELAGAKDQVERLRRRIYARQP
jgi:hypothetical protein